MKKQFKKAVLAFTLAVSSSGMAGKFDKYGDSSSGIHGMSNTRGVTSGFNPLGITGQQQTLRATYTSGGWGGLPPRGNSMNFMLGGQPNPVNVHVTVTLDLYAGLAPRTQGPFDRFVTPASTAAPARASVNSYNPMDQMMQMQANKAEIAQAGSVAAQSVVARQAAQPLTPKQMDLESIDLK